MKASRLMRPLPNLLVIGCLVGLVWLEAGTAHAQDIALPADSGFVNVLKHGAKGDGITDTTDALQRVFGRNKKDPGGPIREIYLPNGVYLVCDTLAWGDKKKDVRGQSRDGVIIKLKDHCPGFQDPTNPKKVLQIEFGHGGQNFNQRLRNLTVDIGRAIRVPSALVFIPTIPGASKCHHPLQRSSKTWPYRSQSR